MNSSTASTLNDILRRRAELQPGRLAYEYLADGDAPKASLTYAELDARARAVAAALQNLGATGGRALLLYPPGLDFIAAFFGCLYAGVVAVPAYPPHPARPALTLPRLRSIASDAQASIIVTTSTILHRVEPLYAGDEGLSALNWLATDVVERSLSELWCAPKLSGESLAFLQYTSGSTSAPKGVMVSHRNLLRNSAYVNYGFEHTPESVAVTWLPAYHDMGLIDGIIQPMYSGFPCYLMAPAAFLQRPLRWLQAVSDYRATHSGGPNFAYELCARKIQPAQREQLDLSRWRVAYNGAEPIRLDTLERFAETFAPCGFRREALYPAYGLAEATLKVSGSKPSRGPVTCAVEPEALAQNRVVECDPNKREARAIVGSGRVEFETRVAVVDPETLMECATGRIGEVWVSGPGVAQGYWQRPELTETTFRARLADSGEGPFLRTGDLGFLRAGELYITGRLKDIIIIGGRNHYPQDVELTAEQSHPSLRAGCAAAFSIEVNGEERLVIAAEVEHRYKPAEYRTAMLHARSETRYALDLKLVTKAVQRAVSEEHGLHVHTLTLLKTGSIPKTSSGKLRRRACRDGYLNGALECVVVA